MLLRSATGSNSRRSIPSTVMAPSRGSYSRQSNFTSVVLPEPLGPTSAATSPGLIWSETLSSAVRAVSGYWNVTSSKTTPSRIGRGTGLGSGGDCRCGSSAMNS